MKAKDLGNNTDHRKYFHEISQTDVNELILEKRTNGYISKNYKQPDWCVSSEALDMKFGCWSLCDLSEGGNRTKISKEFCKKCEAFRE